MSEQLNLEQVPGNPVEINQSDLESLAQLYARVFADEPWNEYTICPTSGTFFGRDTKPGDMCEECKTSLQLAYPLKQTAEYITGELSRDNAAAWLLRDGQCDDKIVGFTWGFAYESPEAFAQAKYKTPEMQVSIGGLLRELDLGRSGLWYLSESGIENDERYRGKGLSRVFHERRLETARSLALTAIQRTSAYGNMYRTSKRTMTQIMGVETAPGIDNGRLRPAGNIVNGIADTEIEGRVLFARDGRRKPLGRQSIV
jgi:hypothetical protein